MANEMTNERALQIHTDMYNALKNKNYQSADELARNILPGLSNATGRRLLRQANEKCLKNRLTEHAIFSLSIKGKGYFIQTNDNIDDVLHAINESMSRSRELELKGTAQKLYFKKYTSGRSGKIDNKHQRV